MDLQPLLTLVGVRMRKVLAWRVAGYSSAVLGFMVVGGLAALSLVDVEVPNAGVGFAASTAATLLLTALCLLLSAALLEGNDRTSAQTELAELRTELSDLKTELYDLPTTLNEVADSLECLRGAVDERLGTVEKRIGTAEKRLGSGEMRLGAAERQLHAARSAEFVLTRAQREVDQRNAELPTNYPPNVHHIR